MKQLIAILLIVLGFGFAAWAGLVGLAFSGVYLMGYIGTSGREAGSELLWMLLYTTVAVTVGVAIGQLGRWLNRKRGAPVA